MLRQSDDMNILKSTEAPRLTALTRLRKPVHSPLIPNIIFSHIRNQDRRKMPEAAAVNATWSLTKLIILETTCSRSITLIRALLVDTQVSL